MAGKNYDCDLDRIYTRQEIAAFPLILLERKASSRVFLEQEFLKAGVTLTPEIELSSRQLLVTLAEIGLGVAGVTLEFVHKELESGGIRLLKTDFDIPERSGGYVHAAGGASHGGGRGLYGNGAERRIKEWSAFSLFLR